MKKTVEGIHYTDLRAQDKILAESPKKGCFVVEREVPFADASSLPTELGSVVMVINGAIPYVWERTSVYIGAGSDMTPWSQAGTSMPQTDEQLLVEANRYESLEILWPRPMLAVNPDTYYDDGDLEKAKKDSATGVADRFRELWGSPIGYDLARSVINREFGLD